jgi:hypothetical protein
MEFLRYVFILFKFENVLSFVTEDRGRDPGNSSVNTPLLLTLNTVLISILARQLHHKLLNTINKTFNPL